jgi:peptidoglycan/xylan/chitin deacetylase (PgdA/CDA1 family)
MPGAIAYTFRRGDALPRLAQHAGVSLETLRAFNGLSADSKSDVGQRICFPPGSIPPNQWPQPTPRPYPSCTLAQPPGQAPVIHLGPSDRKRVALTFDIGFYPHIARKMVQRLAELDLRATFFIIGVSGEQDPGQIRAILAGGHELGNHSWSHTDMTRLTPAQIRTELHRTEDFVRQVAPGAAMKPFFRAPFDHLNATVAQTAREEGYYIVNWSADAMDWVPGITPDEVLLSLRWGLRPGAIIALHASSPATLDALPAIRDLLIAEGYEAVPLSTLLAPANSPSSQ